MSIYIGDCLQDKSGYSDKVSIPIHHTGLFGMTGVGKTTLIKKMLAQAVDQGFKVLIFDSKITGAEFEDAGYEVPFYLEQSTDPDVVRSLCEGTRTVEKGDLKRYRGGFIEICEEAKDFSDIGRRLQEKLADTKHIHGSTRMMYREIQHDMTKLVDLMSEHDFSSNPQLGIPYNTLNSNHPIVVVPTHKLPNLALQGLVVRSFIQYLLKADLRKIIVLVDEAPNFIPQKKYNPAKDALQQLDAQGRSHELFGWYSGQTITGIDKDSLKNTWYWIMGREMEKNEVKGVYDTQSYKATTIDGIKHLKVGQFIVSTPDWAKVVTVPKTGEIKFKGHYKGEAPLSRAVIAGVEAIGTLSPPDPIERIMDEIHRELQHTPVVKSDPTDMRKDIAKWNATLLKPADIPTPPQPTLDGGADFRTSGQIVDDSIKAAVQIEKLDLEYLVSHSPVLVHVSTKTKGGQLTYILRKAARPMSTSEIESEAPEHGWSLGHSHITDYVNGAQGAVVQNAGGGWRLAKFVNVEVTEG